MAGPARQIVLPLDWRKSHGRDDILITPANRQVIEALAISTEWPNRTAILTGPPRSGKSLIGRHFEQQSGAIVLDDADAMADDSLFHAWNRAQDEKRALLLISRLAPAQWGVTLPDLRSRLGAALLLDIGFPDAAMVTMLIQKHLADLGTGIFSDALAFAEKRIERSYAGIEDFAGRANEASLSEGRAISLAVVKPILAAQGELEL